MKLGISLDEIMNEHKNDLVLWSEAPPELLSQGNPWTFEQLLSGDFCLVNARY
jgi:hypothetical protein